MDLLLLRHGIAATSGSMPDEERPLTAEGREKLAASAKGMRKLFDKLDLVLTSPLVRARETAEIIASEFKAKERIEVFPELAMGGSLKLIAEEVAKNRERERLVLVGHEPEMVQLHSLVTGARHGTIHFKKGALACYSISGFQPKLSGVLLYYLWSKQLRLIGAE